MRDMIKALETIANNDKLPGCIVDWASDVYDQMNDANGTVRTRDLRALYLYMLDPEAANAFSGIERVMVTS